MPVRVIKNFPCPKERMPKAKKLKVTLSRFLAEQSQKAKVKAKERQTKSYRKQFPSVTATATTQQSKCPYTVHDRILLLGEGNFSFARSLVESHLHTAENMIATCLDSEIILCEKYPEAKANVEAVKEMGGMVLFEIDATKLEKCKELKNKRFDKVVFLFPHTGAGIKDQERNIRAHQTLLLSIFTSALSFLAQNDGTAHGELHITLKSGLPYDMWDIRSLARSTGELAIKTTFPFVSELYPGYEHRRTLGFKEGVSKEGNEEIKGKNPKTYVFVSKEVMEGEVEKARNGMLRKKLEIKGRRAGKNIKKITIKEESDGEDSD